MDDACLYVPLAIGYGSVGAILSTVYYRVENVRHSPFIHALTLIAIVSLSVVALTATTGATPGGVPDTLAPATGATVDSAGQGSFAFYHLGLKFFLFLGAGLAYAPVIVYLGVHYAELLLDRVLSPASRRKPPSPPSTERGRWQRVEACLARLVENPTDAAVRERLADLYAGMGFIETAIYEYAKASEWLDGGYAHAHVLYKAARLIVEAKKDPAGAMILLRRIVRLYPRSCFAAYARRILNHHGARLSVSAEENATDETILEDGIGESIEGEGLDDDG